MTDESIKPLFDNMAVIGVGLIGGSLGLAAKRYNLAKHVVGYGRSKPNLDDALRLGAVDAVADSVTDCVKNADIVFICTPVRTVAIVLEEIAGHLIENAIVTDVGSTKRAIVEQAGSLVPQGRHFIGGHPMAGTEKSGAIYAFPELFRDATYVLTPNQETDTSALEKLNAFVDGVGARCEIMSPLEHDRSVAVISHLPHIIASSLLEAAEASNQKTGKSFKLAAGSFRDLTRIADSSPDIWRDICVTNADLICNEIEELVYWLNRFKTELEEQDDASLLELFEKGRQIREAYTRIRK